MMETTNMLPLTSNLPSSSLLRVRGAAGLALLSFLVLTPAVPSHADPERQPSPSRGEQGDDRDQRDSSPFARVRFVEGVGELSGDDGGREELRFNLPAYVGDRLEMSSGRTELQLPDGSLVRLDQETELELYALGDDSRRFGQSLLGLSRGSLQVDLPDLRNDDAFRVDTPSASVYPLDRSAFRVDVEPGGIVRVSVERGRVEVAAEQGSVVLYSGQRSSVRDGGRPASPWRYNVMLRDGFDGWVARRDDVYAIRERRGREYDELPDEVRPYYRELSGNGRWVYDDDWGWVWSPRNVESDWRPYWSGYWSPGPFGPVWVSSEPWGWCVYRYGRWDFRVGFGWCWIPGRVFAPAHVAWYYGPSYVGWCPLGWWDSPVRLTISFGWGDPWFDHCPWHFSGYDSFYYSDWRRPHPPRTAVIADLRRGVVVRHAVVLPGRGELRGVRGGGAVPNRHAIDRDSFSRAQAIAARDRDDAIFIDRQGRGRDAQPRLAFRDRERGQVEHRVERGVARDLSARGRDLGSDADRRAIGKQSQISRDPNRGAENDETSAARRRALPTIPRQHGSDSVTGGTRQRDTSAPPAPRGRERHHDDGSNSQSGDTPASERNGAARGDRDRSGFEPNPHPRTDQNDRDVEPRRSDPPADRERSDSDPGARRSLPRYPRAEGRERTDRNWDSSGSVSDFLGRIKERGARDPDSADERSDGSDRERARGEENRDQDRSATTGRDRSEREPRQGQSGDAKSGTRDSTRGERGAQPRSNSKGESKGKREIGRWRRSPQEVTPLTPPE